MVAYNHYIGPWVWDTSGDDFPFWRAPEVTVGLVDREEPEGTVGLIDLRSTADLQLAGTDGDRPYGFFVVNGSLNSDYTLLGGGSGDVRKLPWTAADQSAWQSLVGTQPMGDTLIDALFDHLTNQSDPLGDTPTQTMMPNVAGNLDLHLGGYSLVKSQRFIYDSNRPEDRLYREKMTAHLHAQLLQHDADGLPVEQMQRVVDFWTDKFRIGKGRASHKRLIPSELRERIPGILPHQTTITESWNQSDSSTLGPDLTWTETLGSMETISNEVTNEGTDNDNSSRAEADLSSDDHYCKTTITGRGNASRYHAALCRYHASQTNTYYYADLENTDKVRLYRRVTGSYTQLGSGVSVTVSLPDTIQVKADGNNISCIFNDVLKIGPVSDPSGITGNLRCGIRCTSTGAARSATQDSFEAADLAVGGTALPMAIHHYQMAGGL